MDITILLADDHKLMREGLRTLIAEQPNMTVAGEAEDGGTAVALAEKLRPQIVIMDISMPGMNGIEATARIAAAGPSVKVIALSMHLDTRMVLEMLNAGARGYLLKDCAFHEVISAINRVSSGGGYISNRVAEVLVKEYGERVRQSQVTVPDGLEKKERQVVQLLCEGRDVKAVGAELHCSVKAAELQCQQAIVEVMAPGLYRALNLKGQKEVVTLTGREKEILVWVKEGKNNWEIASILAITQDTVKFHMKNIFQKLNVSTRSQAIAAALELNLIELK